MSDADWPAQDIDRGGRPIRTDGPDRLRAESLPHSVGTGSWYWRPGERLLVDRAAAPDGSAVARARSQSLSLGLLGGVGPGGRVFSDRFRRHLSDRDGRPQAGSSGSRGWREHAVSIISECASGQELDDGCDGVGVGEELGIVVVGRLAGGVADPPGGLERDAVGVGEVDGSDDLVVDDIGDLPTVALQTLAECVECLLVGKVQAQMVELGARSLGTPARFTNGWAGTLVYSKKATVHWGPNSKK